MSSLTQADIEALARALAPLVVRELRAATAESTVRPMPEPKQPLPDDVVKAEAARLARRMGITPNRRKR